MPGWLKTILNIIAMLIPEIIKGFFVKPDACEQQVEPKKKDLKEK